MEFPPGYNWAKTATPDFQHHAFGDVAVDLPRMVALVYWALRSAQEMRSGDPRFAFATAALETAKCHPPPE